MQHREGDGTMTAVIILSGLGLTLLAAAWVGWHVDTLVYPVVHTGYPVFIATLVHWHSVVIWHGTQRLPSPVTWHWVAAISSGLAFVAEMVLAEGVYRAVIRKRRGTGGVPGGPAPLPRPRGY
ncbi:MAG: hypothetical protein M0008_03200 [Actinomycetota bacterium]|nr:hypothetical protein [Actinomycetota bacterium]